MNEARPPKPGSLTGRLTDTTTTVLVVEDEPDIASFLGAFFRASGLSLAHIAPRHADDVVAKVAELHPRCVLLDLRLGPTTGYAVLEALGAAGALPDLPVIVLTATGSDDARTRCAALGAVELLTKPFSVKDVFSRVQRLVADDNVAGGGAGADDDVVIDLEPDAVRRCVADGLRQARPCAVGLVRAEEADADLGTVADVLADSLHPATVAAGAAPDELVVVVPGHSADRLADALSAAVADIAVAQGITLRAGVAAAGDGVDADTVLAAARTALAASLRRGPVATAR